MRDSAWGLPKIAGRHQVFDIVLNSHAVTFEQHTPLFLGWEWRALSDSASMRTTDSMACCPVEIRVATPSANDRRIPSSSLCKLKKCAVIDDSSFIDLCPFKIKLTDSQTKPGTREHSVRVAARTGPGAPVPSSNRVAVSPKFRCPRRVQHPSGVGIPRPVQENPIVPPSPRGNTRSGFQ